MIDSINCCGKMRCGSFCEDCGKRLRDDDSLWALVSYCRKRCETCRKSIARHENSIAEKKAGRDVYCSGDSWYQATKRSLIKWENWGDRLCGLLKIEKEKDDASSIQATDGRPR